MVRWLIPLVLSALIAVTAPPPPAFATEPPGDEPITGWFELGAKQVPLPAGSWLIAGRSGSGCVAPADEDPGRRGAPLARTARLTRAATTAAMAAALAHVIPSYQSYSQPSALRHSLGAPGRTMDRPWGDAPASSWARCGNARTSSCLERSKGRERSLGIASPSRRRRA